MDNQQPSIDNYFSKRLDIPIETKASIWKKRVGKDQIYTYCENNCGRMIYMSDSVRKKLAIPAFTRIPGYSTVEYGHIISDKNGGLPIEDNLMLLCLDCNRAASSTNMCQAPSPMVDENSGEIWYMNIAVDDGYCSGITTDGLMCKMKPSQGNKTCSTHSRQKFAFSYHTLLQ